MEAIETDLKGCFIIKPKIFEDDRGYFFESFHQQKFEKLIAQTVNFVQDNQSYSTRNVLRGLHFQTGNFAQAKLVRVTKGKVLDVAVDLRKNSDTFGAYFSCILDDIKHEQLFVPRGFAHGFVVLSDIAIFNYKCDNFYNKESESGIHYLDPIINIDWGVDPDDAVVSDKDQTLPFLDK